ncbi:DUF2778 domain-containing protein [Trinickia sp. NRRL B-1857]|uniref:DUF2778 domain-containing protein n=1 Tax=Trinickia sp. NRRL B-1857 TaxID=3162879 RepID=UPI003D2CDB73
MPAACFFRLNGKRLSTLDCLDLGSILAFSGNGRYINNPESTAVPKDGPIPKGKYYIVARQSGGRHGQEIEKIEDTVSGTHRADWFALYTMTPPVGDSLVVNGVRRANFRLHPVGYWGISEGCITLPSVDNFYVLRNWLLKQKTAKIPGTNVDYYGTVTVQ